MLTGRSQRILKAKVCTNLVYQHFLVDLVIQSVLWVQCHLTKIKL
jgi:hypothetical protein